MQSLQRYPSGSHLCEQEHAPEIFVQDGTYATAVDLWSVNRLIQEWDMQSAWKNSPQRARYTLCLLDCDPSKRPTAAQALKTLQGLRLKYDLEKL